MAGFSSQDDLLNQMTVNNKFWRADWNKSTFGTTAHTAGMWYLLSQTGGNPTASTMLGTGTNLSFQPAVYDDPEMAAIPYGGMVGAAGDGYKNIVNASAFSAAATTMPAVFMLVDILGFYTVTTVTTTGAQTLINSIAFTADAGTDVLTHTGYDLDLTSKVQLTTTGTLPAGLSLATDYWTIYQSASTSKIATSYANAIAGTAINITDAGSGTHTLTVKLPRYSDGAGVQAIITPSTVMGASTTTTYTLGYTNAAGVDSRATPSTPALPLTLTTAPVTSVVYSGTGAGKYGPFMPLQAGDTGIRLCNSINLSATHTSGVLNVVLMKPLLTLPMTTIGVAAERDLVNQLPSLPKVYDGACLAWMMYAGASTPTNSAFYGHLDFAWS